MPICLQLYLRLKNGYMDSEKFNQSGYFCDDPRITNLKYNTNKNKTAFF